MPNSRDPSAVVSDLIDGAWRAQVVGAFVRLGCADALLDRPSTAPELARATNAHPATLQRLLRAAVALGLCDQSEGVVTLTTAGELLTSTHAMSMRPWAVLLTDPWLTRAWEFLPHAVRTGDAAFPIAHGVTFWEYVAARPDEAAFFNHAMTSGAAARAAVMSAHVDLAHVKTVVDVGGGEGQLLTRLLADHHHLRGIVVDRPEVVADAERSLDESMQQRLEFHAGDLFAAIPSGADLYILSRILHDWNEPRALDILRACRRVMEPGARVCVLEAVLAEDDGGTREDAIDAAVKDLNMLVLVGGQERTATEYEELLVGAGFVDVKCTMTGDVADVVTAVAR